MTLTDEEIRIKVAEAMGLDTTTKTIGPRCKGNTPYEAGDDYGITIWAKCKNCNNTGKVEPYHTGLPNYPLDLNACAEFEATLNDAEQDAYWCHIVNLCNEEARNQNNFKLVGIFYQITAKPKQRCLAYLKTKGILP